LSLEFLNIAAVSEFFTGELLTCAGGFTEFEWFGKTEDAARRPARTVDRAAVRERTLHNIARLVDEVRLGNATPQMEQGGC